MNGLRRVIREVERRMMNFNRYAIYFAPRQGALNDAASRWLGRDAIAACAIEQPYLPGLPGSLDPLTATPRRYGFHATLKPPFCLADGATEDELKAALERGSSELETVELGRLLIRTVGRFVALVPEREPPGLANLAAEVVRRFDGFRAAPPPHETARRRAAGLSHRQEELLATWGYPYVMDEFRFHMTLSEKLDEALLPQVRAAAETWFAPVLEDSLTLADLCLFGEEGDSTFRLIGRYGLFG